LILDYEVGGGRPYYENHLARPTWPGASSGVTIGVGYDCGYNSAPVIRHDWDLLDNRARSRLAATALVSGARARPLASSLRDVLIRWNIAETVFNRVTLARFTSLTARTFPGFEQLETNAQAALVSLIFNRGSSMTGPRRAEMRAIRAAVPRRDYRAIAAQLRAMKRIWSGQGMEGLLRRREAEARLVESCVH
jgi:GH24 family phage-related lysozyme (muramidase)